MAELSQILARKPVIELTAATRATIALREHFNLSLYQAHQLMDELRREVGLKHENPINTGK